MNHLSDEQVKSLIKHHEVEIGRMRISRTYTIYKQPSGMEAKEKYHQMKIEELEKELERRRE